MISQSLNTHVFDINVCTFCDSFPETWVTTWFIIIRLVHELFLLFITPLLYISPRLWHIFLHPSLRLPLPTTIPSLPLTWSPVYLYWWRSWSVCGRSRKLSSSLDGGDDDDDRAQNVCCVSEYSRIVSSKRIKTLPPIHALHFSAFLIKKNTETLKDVSRRSGVDYSIHNSIPKNHFLILSLLPRELYLPELRVFPYSILLHKAV